MTIRSVVIVGTGQAGFQAAVSLRKAGFDGSILMLGDEPGLPYQRPPLSKTYFKDGQPERLLFRNRDFFDQNDIAIEDRTTVVRIDREAQYVELEEGRQVAYDHLILATGTRNRALPIPGAALANVVGLRTLADAEHIRRILDQVSNVVMIGGGFIGLEVASVLRDLGREVTVLEVAPRLMARAVSEPVSAHFLNLHRKAGIRVECGIEVAEITGDAQRRAQGVELADGTGIPGDLVFICAGVVPNAEIAADAGLDVDNGICIDEHLLTSDANISAIGDCASFVHKRSGRRVRLESVQNAVDQARCVAGRICGEAEVYDSVAWFWSDQGGAKLQIAGLTDIADRRVVRSDEPAGKLSVFAFEGDDFLGVETINAPGDHMAARKVLAFDGTISYSDLERNNFNLRDTYSELNTSNR